jgi:hypothetical protein
MITRMARASEPIPVARRAAGHANISITLDRYGHLMPGSGNEAAGLLDAYLMAQRERVERAARSAGGELTGAEDGFGAARMKTA